MNFRSSLLQNLLKFNHSPVRFCKTLQEGIQYPGFIYYPRTKDFKDPPYNPSKLFLVIRHKNVKGTNPTERRALEMLNIDGSKVNNCHINVVKNIPAVNALLWKVKHLVTIRPITWKGELPKDGDYSGTFLRKTGELIISPKLKLSPEEMEATKKYLDLTNKLDRKYFKKYLGQKWLNPFTDDIY